MTTALGEPGTPRLDPVPDPPPTVPLAAIADEMATTALLRIGCNIDGKARTAYPPPLTEPLRPSAAGRRYDRHAPSAEEQRATLRSFVLATTVAIGSIIVVRAGVQHSWGQATGLDIGNWLTLGRAWLGNPVSSGAGSTYPPVVPVLAALLESVMPLQYTAMVLGALGTALLGGGTAAVLWRGGVGWWSLPLAVLLAAGSGVGEALAWGGIPQLISLGMTMVALYLIAELLGSPSTRPAWLLGGVLLALGATSHLLFAIVAAAAAIMLAFRLTWAIPRPTRAGVRRFVAVWLRALLPCLALAPLYLELTSTVGGSFTDRAGTQDIGDLLQAIDGVVREMPLLWRPAIVFSLLLPVVLWRERRRPLWLMTASTATLMGAVALLSPEPRFAYILPLTVAAAFGLLFSCGPLNVFPALRALGACLLILGITVTSVRGLAVFPDQMRYYGSIIPAGTQTALDDLRAKTDPDAVVLVPPVRGLPFGWWVEGYGRRSAIVGSSAMWLNFGVERERAALSVDLFSQTDVLSDRWFAVLADAGIDVVYLPANYDGISEETRQVAATMKAGRVVHFSDAALVMTVPRQ